MNILICSLLFLFSLPVLGFESFPEYQSLTEVEQESFDRPDLMGPEYLQNVLSYLKPAEWEYEFLRHDIALDGSAGSISAVHFAIDNRAKIRAKFLKFFEFRFTYFNEGNHDRQDEHHAYELVAWLLPWLGVSAYAEPAYSKRHLDDGVALLLKPNERHEIRFFNTWVDVTRQKRSDRNDKFAQDQVPYARGFVGRFFGDPEKDYGEFFEYGFRHETRTKWHFPDEKYDYSYFKFLAMLYWSKPISEKLKINFRAQADRRYEGRHAIPGYSNIIMPLPETWTTNRLSALVQVPFYAGTWEWTPGFEYAYRQWVTERDSMIYNDYIPNLQLRIPTFGEGKNQDHFTVWTNLAYHRKSAGNGIGHPGDKDKAINSRMNFIYEFNFNRKAEIRLIAGIDVDAFGTRDSWEGGCLQLRWALD